MKSALLFESGISTQNLFQLFHWPSDQVWSCLGLWLESFQALHLLIQPLTDWSLKIKPMKLFVFPIRKFGVPQVPTESLPFAAQALGKRHISGDLGRCQRRNCWSISLCYWLIEIQMRVPKWSINFIILYVSVYIYECIYRLLRQAVAPECLLLNCDIRNAPLPIFSKWEDIQHAPVRQQNHTIPIYFMVNPERKKIPSLRCDDIWALQRTASLRLFSCAWRVGRLATWWITNHLGKG